MKGRLEARMVDVLESRLSPETLDVRNTSDRHSTHVAVRDSGTETHFTIKIRSKTFNGMVSRGRQ